MRISDWSSDVCSSDLRAGVIAAFGVGRHLALEVADERRNILDAAGQAGDLEHNHAEPEEQVFAEFAFGDRGAELLVGGRTEADVDGLHLAADHADDRPLCEPEEQFDLHVETHVAAFDEQASAAIARSELCAAAGIEGPNGGW